MKSHSAVVALYLYESNIWSCMEYCYHVWAGSSSCYLKVLDKLQKQMYRTAVLLFAVSLEPLAHRPDVTSLNLFGRYFVDVHQNWLNWLLIFEGGLLVILIDRIIFVTIPRHVRMSMSTVSFVAQLDSGILYS